MEHYDYRRSVKNDIRDYLHDSGVGYVDPNGSKRQELEDEMFVSDSVTGNASGSYTFSTWKAEENLCHNSDLLENALSEFGGEFKNNPEGNDVTIRCYLLNRCFTEVLDEWNDEHPEDDEDESEDEDEE